MNQDGLNAYSRSDGKGGVIVDTQGMAVDLIMVLKAGGIPRHEFLANMAGTWDEVHVEVVPPPTDGANRRGSTH